MIQDIFFLREKTAVVRDEYEKGEVVPAPDVISLMGDFMLKYAIQARSGQKADSIVITGCDQADVGRKLLQRYRYCTFRHCTVRNFR